MVLGKFDAGEADCPECHAAIREAIDRNEFIKCLGEGLTERGLVLAKMNLNG